MAHQSAGSQGARRKRNRSNVVIMHENAQRRPFSLKTGLLIVCGFSAALLIIYGSSLSNGFIALDDPYVIYNNVSIRSITPATIKHIFTTYDPELYTPLTFFSFQINYLLGGLDPFVYHLTNLLLHGANALLVAWLLTLLLGNATAGIIGGLLFAVHPVNVEVVAWATARKEVLSVFFCLLSFITYLSYRTKKSILFYCLSILLFLCALLSKVNVFVLPLLLLLTDFLQERSVTRRLCLDKIPYAVLSVIFVIVGLLKKQDILSSTTLLEKILMASKSTLFYVWKFIAPLNLSILYPQNGDVSLSSPVFLASLVSCIVLLVLVSISLRWNRKILFGFAFFLLSISPTFVHFNRNAGIVSGASTGIQIASDHYMYLPIIGLLYLVMAGFLWLWNRPQRLANAQKSQTFIALALTALCIGFSYISHVQAAVWKNSETLFLHTLALYPYSSDARVGLSVVYRQSDLFEKEKKVLEEGMTYGPNAKLLVGLAAIAVRQSDYLTAEKNYDDAIRIDPNNSEAYFGKGVLLARQGKNDEATVAYKKAIELNAFYPAAHSNLGSLQLVKGQEAEAEENFQKAVSINPTFAEGYYNLGSLYRTQKKTEDALRNFEQAITINPLLLEARLAVVPLYLEQGRNTEAFDQLKAILAVDPKNTTAKSLVKEMINLGIIGAS